MEDLQSGEIILDGKKVLGPSYNLIPGFEDMKLVSQDFYVLENHTVEENIFDKLVGYSNESKEKRASKILKLLQLQPIKNTRAKHLSSGQKQRVAIARALAVIPKILLLDEPFSNLDNLLTEKLFSFLKSEVKKNNTAVILITHIAEEALKNADSLAIMDNGKILQIGEKWNVYYKPRNSKLAGLLGDYNIILPKDLEKKATGKRKTKMFLRPDKIKKSGSKSEFDLALTIQDCKYNGKCFELTAETKSGNSVIVYSQKPLSLGVSVPFSIID